MLDKILKRIVEIIALLCLCISFFTLGWTLKDYYRPCNSNIQIPIVIDGEGLTMICEDVSFQRWIR